MENPSNQVSSDIITDNPQATQSAELGAGSVDFQQALPSDKLNNQGLSLGLEDSVGEQTTSTASSVPILGSNQLPVYWLAAIGLVILIAIFLLYKLIREAAEEDAYDREEPVKDSKPKKNKELKKKSSSTTRKKSAPNQRRKNVSKNRKK